MDPDELVQCPYDKNHQVRASRLPYHLVKCERNNPEVACTLATCDFNARHRVPRHQLRSHLASCPNRPQQSRPLELDAFLSQRVQEVPVAQPTPPCEEDWEAEVENMEKQPPFIFCSYMNHLPLRDSSVPANPRRDVNTKSNPEAQEKLMSGSKSTPDHLF